MGQSCNGVSVMTLLADRRKIRVNFFTLNSLQYRLRFAAVRVFVIYAYFHWLRRFQETALFSHPATVPVGPPNSHKSNNSITFALSHSPPAEDAFTSGGKLAACGAHSLAHASQGLAGKKPLIGSR